MKKTLDVEKLLQWAYRDELPKKGMVESSPGWDHISSYGGRIDEGDHARFPVALGGPHPDALVVEQAVQALAKHVLIDWAESITTLLGELIDYHVQSQWRCGTPFSPRALVVMHARMGTRPPWESEPPRLVRVIGPNGKPVVNGVTPKGRYLLGAHCPLRLEPSVDLIVSGRAEYSVWRQSLDAVRESLSGWPMREYAIGGIAAASEPWLDDAEIKPRVLRSTLTPQAVPASSPRPPRPRVRAAT